MNIKSFISRFSLLICAIAFTAQSQAIMIHLSSTTDLTGSPTLLNGVGFGETFDVHVLVDNIDSSISSIDAFEFAVNYDTASLSLLSEVNAGDVDVAPYLNEFIVGVAPPGLSTTPEPVWLATLTFQNISISLIDSLITIGPTTPSSFPGDNVGGIYERATDEITPFDYASGLLVNQVSVATPDLYPASSVPEPSIIWLLSSGLALIGFVRRKRP